MVPLHRGDLRQDAARLPRERTRLNEHLRQVYTLNWAAIRFQSIDDNYASIVYRFMPLHIDLCINLQVVYFTNFVFTFILLGVQPTRQSQVNEWFYDSPQIVNQN